MYSDIENHHEYIRLRRITPSSRRPSVKNPDGWSGTGPPFGPAVHPGWDSDVLVARPRLRRPMGRRRTSGASLFRLMPRCSVHDQVAQYLSPPGNQRVPFSSKVRGWGSATGRPEAGGMWMGTPRSGPVGIRRDGNAKRSSSVSCVVPRDRGCFRRVLGFFPG